MKKGVIIAGIIGIVGVFGFALYRYYSNQVSIIQNSTSVNITDIRLNSITDTSAVIDVDMVMTNLSALSIVCSGFDLEVYMVDSNFIQQRIGHVSNNTSFTVLPNSSFQINAVQIMFNPSQALSLALGNILSLFAGGQKITIYLSGNIFVNIGLLNKSIPVNMNYSKTF